MNKRPLALLLLLLMLCSLAACRQDEPDLLVPPADLPAAEESLTLPPDPTVEDPPADRQPAPEPPVSQADWIIDTDFLTARSQTIEYIWPAGDDLLLVFTSTLSGGYVSEQISLYTYDLRDRAFTGDWISLGIVGQYPHQVFHDGTVMVLTRNTETYEYEEMRFIDPRSLTVEARPLGDIEDLRSIHISPDKAYAALSTQQGIRITDPSLSAILAVYPGYVPEGGDPDLDYILPTATGWLQDSSALVGKLLGWEWVHHPFVFYPDGQLLPLEDHEGLSALPFGSDLLLCDSFTQAPYGICTPGGADCRPLEIDLPDQADGSAYLSALGCDGSSGLLGLAIATPEGKDACRADIYHEGKLLDSLTLPQNGAFPVSFDSITFTPDGHKALLMTGATIDYPAYVHIVTLD